MGDIWTEEQVAALAARQANASLHPYTCPGDKAAFSGHRHLIPTRQGWVCACGDYSQTWSHETGLPGPAPEPAAAKPWSVPAKAIVPVQGGEPRRPVDLRCGDCRHVWTGAYLPMEVSRFAALIAAARCPMCGANSRRIFMAETTDG